MTPRRRRRSTSETAARGIDSTAIPAPVSAGAIATPRSSAGQATSRRALRSRQMRSSAAGTSAAVATRWNTPATRSNSARNRSSVCGHRSLSSRRSRSNRWAGWAGRSAEDAAKSPGVFAISIRIRVRKSALELTPPLLEGPRGHRRQVARPGPRTEERRQGADAAVTHEWPLQRAADPGPEPIQRWRTQDAGEGREHDTLGPRRDLLVVDFSTQLDEHSRDVDADRAGIRARAA